MPMTLRAKELLRIKKACLSISVRSFKVSKPAIVSKAKTITKAISKIKGLSEIRKGDKVLIKPNINSDDKYPGTTRPEGLIELIRLLKKKGAVITVGDMSSIAWSHTRECASTVGIKQACKSEEVPLILFENSKWIKASLPGTSLKSCWVTQELCNQEHLINLCVLKTHRMADFTLSMKNLMGCLHMRTRVRMHLFKLKQRIGEFQSVINPCLNIVDGTKSFIEGGPDKGVLYDSGIILASRDRVALDVTGVSLLKSYGSKSLKKINPWKHPQIIAGIKACVGVSKQGNVKVI